jgi:hypothetical protein
MRFPLSMSLLAAITIAACGAPGATGAPESSASAPRVTSPTPTGQSGVFGACRLPVGVPYVAGEPPGGWLDLPSGSFSRDPKSLGVSDSNQIAWDAPFGRWVPTIPRNVSPDGATYVALFDGTFRLVDARTGSVLHAIPHSDVLLQHVVAYTASGIYMSAIHQDMSPVPGLWKVDPSSGALSRVSSAPGYWEIADATSAWGTDTKATVIRMDLATGVATDIYKSSYQLGDVVGFAGAGVLVSRSADTPGAFGAMVVRQDGSVTPVDVPAGLEGKYFNGYFQDGPAVLISGHGFGLAAYDENHGLKVVTTTPDNLAVLGSCI